MGIARVEPRHYPYYKGDLEHIWVLLSIMWFRTYSRHKVIIKHDICIYFYHL
jgi:hypothetical protein